MADVATFFSGNYARGLEGSEEAYIVRAVKDMYQTQPQQQQATVEPARFVYNTMGEADMAGRLAKISAGLDPQGSPIPQPRTISASLEDLRRASSAHRELLARQLDRRAFVSKYAKTEKKLNKERQCVRCHRAFTLASSIGAWQCRMHPGTLSEDGTWTCCRRTASIMDRLDIALLYDLEVGTASGCTPVDHTYMFLDRTGVRNGRGAWRVPPELFNRLLYKPFRMFAPGHDDTDRFAAVWNVRSSSEATSSTLVPRRGLDDTEMEAAIRSGSAIRQGRSRYDIVGSKSIYVGYKSSDAEERRLVREQASRDYLIATSPLPAWDSRWIGTYAFEQLDAERVKALVR